MQINKYSFKLFILIGATCCVPPMKFNELQTENNDCQRERNYLKANNEMLAVDNTELKEKLEKINTELKNTMNDSIKWTRELDNLNKNNELLSRQNDELRLAQQGLMKGSTKEVKLLLDQLETAQADLYTKEGKLNELSKSLDLEKQRLEKLKTELERKNTRLVELENILKRKDEAVNELKMKVSNALTGFENQGLAVNKKNGKVYVSLEEKLLFKSGSTTVDPKGIEALKKLAGVLNQNREINIMIEGHTDDVPVIQGSRFKDNWDLSVQRATAIVRILLDNSAIDPKRLIASGRSKHLPVDTSDSADARKKNRRTEIILSPKLDELFKILENN